MLFISGCVQQNTQRETTSTTAYSGGTTTPHVSTTTSTTASSTSTTPLKTHLEIHEWGVLSGGSLDTSYNVLSTPDSSNLQVVREPVIYVHSDRQGSFNASVTFSSGRGTTSYPSAQTSGDSIQWNGVEIIQDIGNASYPSETLKAVNDVDSNVLQYHGQKTKSLFYEGTVSYENKIRPVYNADRKQALVENKGTYPVYDVLLIAPSNYNKLLGKYLYTDVIPKIAPNEVVTVTLRQTPSGVDYAKDLTRLGYTGKEAEAFAGIWEQEFQKTEKGNGKLIYRLSQEEYNNMIPLKISPEPVKTIRTMYVMICLTGKDTPQAPVIGKGFGIYQGQDLIISEDDILSYNRTSHEIKLTESGLRNMRSKILYEEEDGKLVPKLGGLYLKPFSVRLDGVEIYSGAFWSRLSSSTYDGIVLLDVVSIETEDSIRLEAGYPSPSNYKGTDPRNNPKIMQYLKEKTRRWTKWIT